MSAPSDGGQDEALVGLAGVSVPDGVNRDVLRLDLIGRARENGVTWAAIGASLGGMNGKAAKAAAKRLARDTRRQLAGRTWEPAAGDGGPHGHRLGDVASAPYRCQHD